MNHRPRTGLAVDRHRHLQTTRLTAALIVALLAACSKKTSGPEPTKAPAKPASAEQAAAPTPPAQAKENLPPDLGMALEAYRAARLLERCAIKFGEPSAKAENLALDLLEGKKPAWNLEAVLEPAPTAEAEAATLKAADPGLDSPERAALRAKYEKAHPLADAYAQLKTDLAQAEEECLYAREIGLIEPELIDRYERTFVEVACLQREMVDAKGKPDPIAHAHKAAEVFAANSLTAADFGRLGLVFARFPRVQGRIHGAKASRCPDPRVASRARIATAQYNGKLSGDRNATLQLAANDGKITGAIQWLGASARDAKGQPEKTGLPVTGAISGETLSAFGQVDADWIRFEGKRSGNGFSGSWQGERNIRKVKGSWKIERVPDAPSAAPAAPAADN